METRILMIIGFGILIITGFTLNFDYYQNTIVPVNSLIDDFHSIHTFVDHNQIQISLAEINQNLYQVISKLPETNVNGDTAKNPVWFYGTESTNFLRIQSDVDNMITSIDKLSVVPQDSSAYHAGIMDIHNRAEHIKENFIDARSFMYASATNIFFTMIWIVGVVGIMKAWIKNEN